MERLENHRRQRTQRLDAVLGRITNLDRYYQLDLHFQPSTLSNDDVIPSEARSAGPTRDLLFREGKMSILIYKEDADRLTLPELEAEALRRFRLHIKPAL